MINKLRNQPYAPKWEQAQKVGARGAKRTQQTKSKKSVILRVIHHRQNPLESSTLLSTD
jgi:hypothetical protein